jgi:nicotinamidase/pyrazinamidase
MHKSQTALLIIDMQYDFMQGGSLEVKDANALIVPINDLMKLHWGLIVASKDWHPANHISFASNHEGKNAFEKIILADGTEQVLWPDHCVQNSNGAAIHAAIDQSLINTVVLKGQHAAADSYSAFFDNNKKEKTELNQLLKDNDITSICVAGLAADYCVKYTALDGQALKYKVYYMEDAVKAVHPDENDLLKKELLAAGVHVIRIADTIN